MRLTHQESLSEVEEKYKKAMVSNAQLDNDKANLIYQVDTLKDVVEEMEEQMAELKRELEEKSKVRLVEIQKGFGVGKMAYFTCLLPSSDIFQHPSVIIIFVVLRA